MTYQENDKLKALAIVNILETSRSFGDYAACVVLDDGAGISYGISQFTHRSGSLAAVVGKYLESGAQLGSEVLAAASPGLQDTSAASIQKLSNDRQLKRALKAAAVTAEMKDAQRQVASEKYLTPSLRICAAKNFVLPLSLAVIYDSLNHGSFEWISARVTPFGAVRSTARDADLAEMTWITEYVRVRDRWLSEIRRLRATRYRTKFFLDQIAVGNWSLRLPMVVHGFRLTESNLASDESPSVPEAVATGGVNDNTGKSILTSAGEAVSMAADKLDRVDNVVTAVTSRRDAAKSLWTTVIGTLWQAIWAIFGFLTGLPREVWIAVAVIAAALMLLFLYRQIVLGRIREARN